MTNRDHNRIVDELTESLNRWLKRNAAHFPRTWTDHHIHALAAVHLDPKTQPATVPRALRSMRSSSAWYELPL